MTNFNELTTRSYNCLKQYNLLSVSKLRAGLHVEGPRFLLKRKNIGNKVYWEIADLIGYDGRTWNPPKELRRHSNKESNKRWDVMCPG